MALQLFKIASTTVDVAKGTILFTSIPSGYTDLIIDLSIRDYSGNQTYLMRFNSDTGSNYTKRWIYGNGTGAYSEVATTSYIGWYGTGSPDTTNTFGSVRIYIPNYTSSNYKSISVDSAGENNGTAAFLGLLAGLWSSTSAITSFEIGISYGLTVNSTATLYGVL